MSVRFTAPRRASIRFGVVQSAGPSGGVSDSVARAEAAEAARLAGVAQNAANNALTVANAAATAANAAQSTATAAATAAAAAETNLPDKPAGASEAKKYDLAVATDGTGVWTEVTSTTPPPVQHPSLLFGTSDDAIPTGAELTIQGANGEGTILAYTGSKHQLVARLASEDDITSIIRSDDSTRANLIGGFTKYAAAVQPPGEVGTDYNVWVSNQALTNVADLTLEVS